MICKSKTWICSIKGIVPLLNENSVIVYSLISNLYKFLSAEHKSLLKNVDTRKLLVPIDWFWIHTIELKGTNSFGYIFLYLFLCFAECLK